MVTNSLKITNTAFQSIVWVGLHTIQHIDVRCILTDRHNSYKSLAVRVDIIVGTYQCVTFPESKLRSHILHGRSEVLELQPVKAILAQRQITNANSRHTELVGLGNIPLGIKCRITIILLNNNDIANAQRVIQFAVAGLQPYLSRRWVVVVHFHHVREEAVTVLTQQLRDNHFEYT